MSSILNNQNKEKGILVMTIFRYLLCLLFTDRNNYMQKKRKLLKKDSQKTPFIVFKTV